LASNPLPEKIGLGRSADFLHSGTGNIENVRSIIDFFLADFNQNFSERALLVLKNSVTISVTKIDIVEPVTLKKPCLFHADFNHDFNHDFLHSGAPLLQVGL